MTVCIPQMFNFCILLIVTKQCLFYSFIKNYFTTGHISLQKNRMSKASCTCRIGIFQPSVTSFQSSVRASVSLIKISCSDTLPLSNERRVVAQFGASFTIVEQLVCSYFPLRFGAHLALACVDADSSLFSSHGLLRRVCIEIRDL